MGWKIPGVLGWLDDRVAGLFGDIDDGTTARTWAFPQGPSCRLPGVPMAPSPSIQGSTSTEALPIEYAMPAQTGQGSSAVSWTLGQLSAKYESGGRGSATVSSGKGDAGGVSYGTYQLTSKPGGGRVTQFVTNSSFPWKDRFKGLLAGSKEFTAAWKKLAKEQGAALHAGEHDFIKRTHYDILVSNIADDTGLDIDSRSDALKDVVWSTSVQHGPNTRVIERAVAALKGSSPVLKPTDPDYDRQLIIAIYAERGRRNSDGSLAYFSKNSQNVQKGVPNRLEHQQKDALAELATKGPPTAPPSSGSAPAPSAVVLPEGIGGGSDGH